MESAGHFPFQLHPGLSFCALQGSQKMVVPDREYLHPIASPLVEYSR